MHLSLLNFKGTLAREMHISPNVSLLYVWIWIYYIYIHIFYLTNVYDVYVHIAFISVLIHVSAESQGKEERI